jgi:hypothetical protein
LGQTKLKEVLKDIFNSASITSLEEMTKQLLQRLKVIELHKYSEHYDPEYHSLSDLQQDIEFQIALIREQIGLVKLFERRQIEIITMDLRNTAQTRMDGKYGQNVENLHAQARDELFNLVANRKKEENSINELLKHFTEEYQKCQLRLNCIRL